MLFVSDNSLNICVILLLIFTKVYTLICEESSSLFEYVSNVMSDSDMAPVMERTLSYCMFGQNTSLEQENFGFSHCSLRNNCLAVDFGLDGQTFRMCFRTPHINQETRLENRMNMYVRTSKLQGRSSIET